MSIFNLFNLFKRNKFTERVARKRAVKPYAHRNSKGVVYYLHTTEVTLRGGKKQPIYHFRKNINTVDVDGGLRAVPALLPETHEVRENPRNGFLTISRKEQ